MGGRGTNSGITARRIQVTTRNTARQTRQTQQINFQSQQMPQQNVQANNAPGPNIATNTLSSLTDDQLATMYTKSRTVDMPNHLNDRPDATQKFVYSAGLNEKPMVLDDAAFTKYLRDNNIPQSQVMARSVDGANYVMNNGVKVKLDANSVINMMKYSDLNYIGGKYGGKVYGSGTYFDQNGGRPTGYGSGATAIAVLNPKIAKVISRSQLMSQIPSWQKSHPKLAAALGSITNEKYSIVALSMGYNVISSTGGYYNVIDRKALVYRKSNY